MRKLDKGHMIGKEDSTLHSEVDPEVIIIEEDHIEVTTSIGIKVTIDSRGFEINLDHWLEDLDFPQGLTAEIKINVSVGDNLLIFLKIS